MKKNDLDKMVEATLNSMDAAERAIPAPYLLTRINAKMQHRTYLSAWEKISAVLARPAVVFSLFVFMLMMNVWIISSSVGNNNGNSSLQNLQPSYDEYSMNASTSLFDFENTQP